MILKALCEYYDRKLALGEMPPYGREWKAIPYLIVIRPNGEFVHIQDTCEGTGKERQAQKFALCQSKGRSGSNSWAIANSLWDHYGYVLGLPKKLDYSDKKAVTMGAKQLESFVKEVHRLLLLNKDNKEIKAICTFYDTFERNLSLIKKDPLFAECVKENGTNLAFKLIGQTRTIGTDTNIDYGEVEQGQHQRCLVSGELAPIAILNNPISLLGASAMGAKLVGFQKNSGYDSYHKEQGLNAPISQQVNFAYTTALNSMLSKESANHLYFSGDTLVFWASRENKFENQFSFFFAAPSKDNPDKNVEAINSLLKSPLSGSLNDDDDTRFYVLLLSPNVARISVRLWEETTVRQMAGNMRQYFADLDIIRSHSERTQYSLYEILRNIALQNDIKNLPPMLFNGMMRATIENQPLPALAQMQCLNRIKADQKVDSRRAGLLKAFLNRKHRHHTQTKPITMALDLNNDNQAYLCGRLFSVLEKIQEESAGKLNATIRDRYYASASRTPNLVFPRLIDLSNHHLVKLDNPNRIIYFEKLKGSILDKISAEGFASHYTLDDQSRFAIGYYHQRQDLFTSKEERKNRTEETTI